MHALWSLLWQIERHVVQGCSTLFNAIQRQRLLIINYKLRVRGCNGLPDHDIMQIHAWSCQLARMHALVIPTDSLVAQELVYYNLLASTCITCHWHAHMGTQTRSTHCVITACMQVIRNHASYEGSERSSRLGFK
ncbi:hypothetical protein M405DRAFT_65188 [Rhizopogon salebrosus TDB-379]|nr:hypothetical protein M405DRAFT_65188 [Rhizopogon salebrosus TDB-379]